jgi:hypothetical protein
VRKKTEEKLGFFLLMVLTGRVPAYPNCFYPKPSPTGLEETQPVYEKKKKTKSRLGGADRGGLYGYLPAPSSLTHQHKATEKFNIK